MEVIRQAARRGERVLATAASNTAVDNLAERLLAAGVELVRLGHPARVQSEAVEAYTLDARLEASGEAALARGWVTEANAIRRKVRARSARGRMDWSERRELLAEARRLMGDARHHLRRVRRAIVSAAPIVCATAAGADSAELERERFDLVVLDEATQAPDPMALVALARGRRAVLAGDPRQLPPTVIDLEAERAGLGVTIFERLAPERAVMLTVQHRMHATIMGFPSRSMYDGRLQCADAVASHALDGLGVAEDPLREGPLIFVDTAGKGWDEERTSEDPSTRNPGHAERTVAEVRRLLRPEDVAVITPYDAQVRQLKEKMRVDGLEIGTVDGFQGREKEAIVLDLVRSNPDGDLGFLRDTRRMNVAVTRARRLLLVVGDSATLGGHPYYAEFLETVEAHGTYLSAWTDDAPPFDPP